MKKKVLVLGSTGSIGRAALDVIRQESDSLEVFGLACNENLGLLREQVERFHPPFVCVGKPITGGAMDGAALLTGMKGIKELVAMDCDIVVNGLPGSVGLEPTVEALKHDKILALANKESLVMAGRMVTDLLGRSRATLIPVDSEHSAIFQLLKGTEKGELKAITITASGGPFRNHSVDALKYVTPAEAYNHPTWKMGRKITLDSATLMNKGLEVIEAKWLFDMEPSRINVLIHPESILHGILEMVDGSFVAYMAYPDMRIPIAYALNKETRHALPFASLDLKDVSTLTFVKPDTDRFPSLRLAYGALEKGDSASVTLNASNDVASDAFIAGKIRFTDIPVIIERVLEKEPGIAVIDNMETIWEIHGWATKYTEEVLGKYHD
jgi:1-deoxy-D-xylulose-5-phosphate reductoisomerase